MWFNPWIRVPCKFPFGLQSTVRKWIISNLKWMKKWWKRDCKNTYLVWTNLPRELLIRQTSTSQQTNLCRAGNTGITLLLSSTLGYRGKMCSRTSDISVPSTPTLLLVLTHNINTAFQKQNMLKWWNLASTFFSQLPMFLAEQQHEQFGEQKERTRKPCLNSLSYCFKIQAMNLIYSPLHQSFQGLSFPLPSLHHTNSKTKKNQWSI